MKNDEVNADNEHQENRANVGSDAADGKPIERNETMLDNTEA